MTKLSDYPTVAVGESEPVTFTPPFRAIPTSDAILLERLEVLYRKLDDEGHYVSANTVALAIDRITMKSPAAETAED